MTYSSWPSSRWLSPAALAVVYVVAGKLGLKPAVVVALTAYVSAQDRRRVLDAGFDAHIAKPFDPE